MQLAQFTYTCCICLTEPVKANEHTCKVCQDNFVLVDEQGELPASHDHRTVVGPTDV